jgi:hypothetical protein
METIKIALLACFLLIHSLTASTGSTEDLIPPTRTLETDKAENQAKGKITVVSEPPGLKVLLDGSGIGRTPIWLKQIKPGPHKLRIENSETEFVAMPETILRISLFDDSFIIEEVQSEKETGPETEPTDEGEKVAPETARCKFGYYESPPGFSHCYYGGWGVHICSTDTGLRECNVEGGKAYSCEQLENDLRARDCCRNAYGGFSKSFALKYCDVK